MSGASNRERAFCDAAREYLLSFDAYGVTPAILDSYLNSSRVDTLQRVYEQLLWSAQNASMRTGVVSGSMELGVKSLSPVLFGFDPHAVRVHFGDDWHRVLDDIVRTVKPRGQIRRGPRSIWPQYCRSVVSGATYLSQFPNAAAFYAWADAYDSSDTLRFELPAVISRQVRGFGYALACDFLKELGFTSFAKPDTHIRKILIGLGLLDHGASDRRAVEALAAFSASAGLTPYHVDKLMWLVGSGNFYRHEDIADIPTRRDDFIECQRALFEGSA